MMYRKQLLRFKSVSQKCFEQNGGFVNKEVNEVNSRTYRIKHSARQYIIMIKHSACQSIIMITQHASTSS
jgi:hypothetical protein